MTAAERRAESAFTFMVIYLTTLAVAIATSYVAFF